MSARHRAGAALQTTLALALVVSAGCRKAPEVRRTLTLGVHHVSVTVPDGWQVLDFGREVRLSRGDVTLTLGDLGPVGPEGIGREVERARALWRAGKARDAQWVLKRLEVPDMLFRTVDERRGFWSVWSDVARAPETTPGFAIEEAFDRIQAGIEAFERTDPPTLAADALSRLESEKRREVAERRVRDVEGRVVVVFRTWDQLTHARPRRVAIAIDHGYALALNTEAGAIGAAGLPFEALLASLSFEDSASAGAISGGPKTTIR